MYEAFIKLWQSFVIPITARGVRISTSDAFVCREWANERMRERYRERRRCGRTYFNEEQRRRYCRIILYFIYFAVCACSHEFHLNSLCLFDFMWCYTFSTYWYIIVFGIFVFSTNEFHSNETKNLCFSTTKTNRLLYHWITNVFSIIISIENCSFL